MLQNIIIYVQSCFICACPKASHQKASVCKKGWRPQKPWEVIALELMGPYPQIVAAEVWHLDRYWLVNWVGWSLCYPRGNCISSRPSSWSLQPLWSSRCLLSDNGAQFDSGQWKGTLEERRIEHWMTTIYHPQANPTESWNHDQKATSRSSSVKWQVGSASWWDSVSLRQRVNQVTGFLQLRSSLDGRSNRLATRI